MARFEKEKELFFEEVKTRYKVIKPEFQKKLNRYDKVWEKAEKIAEQEYSKKMTNKTMSQIVRDFVDEFYSYQGSILKSQRPVEAYGSPSGQGQHQGAERNGCELRTGEVRQLRHGGGDSLGPECRWRHYPPHPRRGLRLRPEDSVELRLFAEATADADYPHEGQGDCRPNVPRHEGGGTEDSRPYEEAVLFIRSANALCSGSPHCVMLMRILLEGYFVGESSLRGSYD